MKFFSLIFVFSLVWWSARAADPTGTVSPNRGASQNGQATYLMCKINSTVRTIRVSLEDEECKTLYTKGGVDEVVASGKNQRTCFGVLDNIKSNLEKANWSCRDISSAVVTESNHGAQ